MASLNLSQEDTSTLLARYVDAAKSHGQASLRGDHRAANREYASIRAVWQALRGRDQGVAILTLLAHSDASVRLWAASHALEFAPDRAEPVLEALAKASGPAATDARMTLRQWRRGELRFE
jgi:hypothetical protein